MSLRARLTSLALLLAGCAGSPADATLSVTPDLVTVAQGSGTTVTLSFEATSTADTWTLTHSAPPAGITVTPAMNLLRGGDRTAVNVQADAAATLGQATIHLQAERDLATAPAAVDLVVSVVPAGTGGGAGGGAAGGGAGGGTATTTSNATIIVEPSDNGAALLQAIQAARTSVHMTMYILTNTGVINALIAQKNAGRDVKVLLNQTFPGGAGSNQAVFTQLQNAGVAVRWTPPTFTLTHQKTVILDGATAWIMTMNVTQTSASSNREYLAVDRDPADVADAEAIFTADWSGTAWAPAGKLVVAPVNARFALVTLIQSATATIDVEAEELSDTQICNALAAAGDRGVTVHAVLCNNPPSASQTACLTLVKQHRVSLVSLASPYIHAKSLVVDGRVAYVGSANFTTASLVYNRELGGLFSAAAEVLKVVTTSRADFARGTAL